MRRIVGFSAACLGFIALIMLLVWVMGGFEGANLGFHGWIAIVLGMVSTSVLGVWGRFDGARVPQRPERARRKRGRKRAHAGPLRLARHRHQTPLLCLQCG
jgi:hypothetical protein